jgi:adenylylsulfate kinase-like enzyme
MTRTSVVWITGLSGAGKSTVARALRDRLTQLNISSVLLDGDELREILGRTQAMTVEERRELAGIYGRLARNLAGQGHVVICATISMFHDVRTWNRENIPQYFEVYLRVPQDHLVQRDAKGLYARAAGGPSGDDNVGALVGHNSDFDEPRNPDLVIDNFGDTSAAVAVDQIWKSAFERNGLTS